MLRITKHFGTENYAGKLYIVQNICKLCQFFFYDFLAPKFRNTPSIYTTLVHWELRFLKKQGI